VPTKNALQALNLKNFKGYEGKVYCFTHTPKPSATTVTDSVAIKTALAAPKKTSEGLGTVQKGIGGKPSLQVFGGMTLLLLLLLSM
jgi:LIM domain-containing protein